MFKTFVCLFIVRDDLLDVYILGGSHIVRDDLLDAHILGGSHIVKDDLIEAQRPIKQSSLHI